MDAQIGATLELEGKTNLGHQIIKSYGVIWKIIDIKNMVPFDTRMGSWACITPINNSSFQKWIILCQDYHIGIKKYVI